MYPRRKSPRIAARALSFLLGCIMVSHAKCNQESFRPVLVDTSTCADIVDVLNGSRSLEYHYKNIVTLVESYTIPSTTATPCVVNLVFLDLNEHDVITTTYESILRTENSSSRATFITMFTKYTLSLSDNQMLAVVSCNMLQETEATNNLTMLPTTNFDFILKEPGGQTRVHPLECDSSFCIIWISTPGCINSKHIETVLPD